MERRRSFITKVYTAVQLRVILMDMDKLAKHYLPMQQGFFQVHAYMTSSGELVIYQAQ